MDKKKYEIYSKQNIPSRKPETLEEIYRFLSNEFHPDKKGIEAKELMIELNAAREEALVGNPENLKKLYEDYINKKIDHYA